MVSGLLGGLPGAGATMGTVVNIRAGGSTRLSGAVASSSKLAAVIGGDIKDHEVVIFDFSEAVHLDDSAAMVMRRLFEVASAARTEVVICGLSGSVARTLRTLDILRGIAQDRLTGTLDEARTVASDLLNERPAAG